MTDPQQHTTNGSAPWTVNYQPGAVAADITDADGTAVAEVYVWAGEEAACLAIAHQMAASREMAAALKLHVGKNGHTGGCTQVSAPAYPCSKRCRQTRAALALAEQQP